MENDLSRSTFLSTSSEDLTVLTVSEITSRQASMPYAYISLSAVGFFGLFVSLSGFPS